MTDKLDKLEEKFDRQLNATIEKLVTHIGRLSEAKGYLVKARDTIPGPAAEGIVISRLCTAQRIIDEIDELYEDCPSAEVCNLFTTLQEIDAEKNGFEEDDFTGFRPGQ